MTASESVFQADDYVVRYGLRGFRSALSGLLLWTALTCLLTVRAMGPSIPAAIAFSTGAIGLLAACGVQIWRAARREIVFAVSQDGVYFGPGTLRDRQLAEAVPWDQIRAVELFTDKPQVRGIRSSCPCIGVLAREDGVRLAYRRMAGWRVHQGRLDAVIRRHAPWIPVIRAAYDPGLSG
ncbi:MAG: hypothetical protein ACR2FU_13000 [Streptosporangiaceae bacterium]